MSGVERPWFTRFMIEPDEPDDRRTVWADAGPPIRRVRKPTRAEKWSILIIGIVAFAILIGMVVTLLTAIYLSRH